MSAPLGLVGAAIAGLTAIVIAGTEAWKAYKAEQIADESERARIETELMLVDRLVEMYKKLNAQGRLSSDQRDAFLSAAVGGNVKGMQGVLRGVVGTKDNEDALKKIAELQNQMSINTLEGIEREREAARRLSMERTQQIDDLAA
jgi:hypothetical protein